MIALIISLFQKGLSQDLDLKSILVQGQLVDHKTKEPLPFAHIYNLRTKLGSVTDEQGYFGFDNNNIGDTVSVSFIGYVSQQIIIESESFLQIELKDNEQQLTEVTLEYDNSDYLYKLINSCIKNKSKVKAKGKAYYELHSTIDNKQTELVESFYNAEVVGYDLEELKLKVGRLGIQTHHEGGATLSLESSVAITTSKLMEASDLFYKNPFQLSYSRLRKNYDLYRVKSYSEQGKTMEVVRFIPKSDAVNLFSGTAWINKTDFRIRKINLQCEDCKIHPFRVVSNDERNIESVDLNIVKNFEDNKGENILNHINFTYNIKYSRKEYDLNLKTSVLVRIYDWDHLFYEPKFNPSSERRHDQDYREIGEAPYNAFFWDNHNEYAVFDKGHENENYFNNPNTIHGEVFLHSLNMPGYKQGEFFEHPSFSWSKKRLRFADARTEDTTTVAYQQKKSGYTGAFNGQFKSDMYKFYGKIYLDRNEYNGKVDVVLESIFDSSRSYYKLPVNWKVQVFVNMYFDLVEIEKRTLEKHINASDKSISTLNKLYTDSELRLKKVHKLYLKEVQRGENESALEKWNTLILSKLKINNLDAFKRD